MSGVVVTGAASGIGRASAEALVADGRKVALWDISPEVTTVADGLGMPGAVVDVCDTGAMQPALDAADEALGGIDGLVHAAGRVAAEPVGAYTQESWDAVLDVNLRAQALLVQLLLPYLEQSAQAGAGPAIVGISSIEGLAARPSMLEIPTIAGPRCAFALCFRCGNSNCTSNACARRLTSSTASHDSCV